jgi:hypothetical protein
MRIGAAILVRDMSPSIAATVESLSWTDGIYLYDDGSVDDTVRLASEHARVPLYVEHSANPVSAFQIGERTVRNYVLDRAFELLNCDCLISIDGDELLARSLRPVIEHELRPRTGYGSISLSMWHLYTTRQYLHFWETKVNDREMLDPHTRVIRRGLHFEDIFPDGRHPAIRARRTTLCLNGPHHFHVKYAFGSPYTNTCLPFLPPKPAVSDVKTFLRELPFTLPSDIHQALRLLRWHIDGHRNGML